MNQDPQAMSLAMTTGVEYHNKAQHAFDNGKYATALAAYKKTFEIQSFGFGADSASLISVLIGLAETCIELKDFESAMSYTKRMRMLARKHKLKEQIEIATELILEIEEKSAKSATKQDENIDPAASGVKDNSKALCGNCKSEGAKYRCGGCHHANYCSPTCQKNDWKLHKPICQENAERAEMIATRAKSAKSKPKCGLCGRAGTRQIPVVQNRCCKSWVCQDQENYVLNSFLLNSCYRNHDRYSTCSHHFNEKHKGKWEDCTKCRMDDAPRTKEEKAWKELVKKNFTFGSNITEEVMQQNRGFKTDGTKALLTEIRMK